MSISMKILEELKEVTVGERVYAIGVAESVVDRAFPRHDVRQQVAFFIEHFAVEKGAEATVKAESLRIITEAVYEKVQEIYTKSEEHQARSNNLQNEIYELENETKQIIKQERWEAWLEVEQVKATHIPNEIYTKRMREISKLKKQRTEAQTQVVILESENEKLKQSIQAEVDRVKATRIPNVDYTKKLREISRLEKKRAEAETQVILLESENEELKRRIQELTK